jgi:hypothetical protein
LYQNITLFSNDSWLVLGVDCLLNIWRSDDILKGMSKKLALLGFLMLLFVVPGLAFAQSFTGPIVPQKAGPLQACDLLTLYNNILQFGIYIATVVATLMLTYAGFLYITSSAKPGNIERAHSIFWNVLVGFTIVLVAWIIVSTLLRVFTGQDSFNPFSVITCNVELQGPPSGTNTGRLVTQLPDIPMPETFDEKQRDDENFWRDQGFNCVSRDRGSGVCTQFQNASNASDSVSCLHYDVDDQVCNQWSDDPDALYANPNVGVPGVAPTFGPCSASALESTWGAKAATAGCIAVAETGCGLYDGTGAVRTDRMLLESGQPGFSICAFQINTANTPGTCGLRNTNPEIPGTCAAGRCRYTVTPQCEAAVSAYETKLRYRYGELNRNGGYCHVIVDQGKYDSCVQNLQRPEGCAQAALNLYNNGGWSHWSKSARKCGAI